MLLSHYILIVDNIAFVKSTKKPVRENFPGPALGIRTRND
jgi:hypothetical protein